jgi:hypothetical protein
MSKWKPGDHVRVITRPVTDEDRKKNRYFEHMAGLTGTVQSVYSDAEIAVRVDRESMSKVTADVHKTATLRMREKFASQASEEQKKSLNKEELEFDANYVQLVQGSDLEKA